VGIGTWDRRIRGLKNPSGIPTPPCRQLPSCLVLAEAVRRVSGLSNVKRRERARLLRAGSGEFDDADGVGARLRFAARWHGCALEDTLREFPEDWSG
jgi:hypothetical protein